MDVWVCEREELCSQRVLFHSWDAKQRATTTTSYIVQVDDLDSHGSAISNDFPVCVVVTGHSATTTLFGIPIDRQKGRIIH